MRTLWFVLTAALVAALVAVFAIAAGGGLIDDATAVPIALAVVDIALAATVGWMVPGRAAWRALGPLVELSGLWVLASMLRHVDLGAAVLVVCGGLWLAGACLPALLLWGVPDGPERRHRRVVLLGSAAAAVMAVVAAVLGGAAGPGTTTANADAVLPVPNAARVALAVQSVLVLTVTLVVVVERARRRRDVGRNRSSGVDPLVLAGAWWTVALVLERVVHLLPTARIRQEVDAGAVVGALRPWVGFLAINLPLTAIGALLGTVGYVVVLRPRLGRLPDGRLALRDVNDAVSALSTWIGDPTLRVSFADGEGGWVDSRGRTATPAGPEQGRTVVRSGGRPVALLEHDPALLESPDVIRFAAAITVDTIEADAWAAAAEARVEASRRLASRLVTADHATRVGLLHELERGPLQELRDCQQLLDDGTELSTVTARLRSATTGTREISHGLYPPELIEGGLGATLGNRPGAPRRRLPSAVEVTAFLLARHDPDASFVDRGTMLEMHLGKEPTDEDALDRVRVLGGTCDGRIVALPTGGV